jgi:hypothetical protein
MICAAGKATREDARDYEIHIRHQEQRFRDVRCKAYALTPHPFTYGHLGCSEGVGPPDCGRIDVKVCE